MKKVIRLTESDLVKLIKRVINEQDPGLEINPPAPPANSQPKPTTKTTAKVKPNNQAATQIKQKPKQFQLPKQTNEDQYDFWIYDNTGKKTHSGIVVQKNTLNKMQSNINPELIKISAKTLRGENVVMSYKCGNPYMTVISGKLDFKHGDKKVTNEDFISDLKQGICPQG
jgi:hypothetical protein